MCYAAAWNVQLFRLASFSLTVSSSSENSKICSQSDVCTDVSTKYEAQLSSVQKYIKFSHNRFKKLGEGQSGPPEHAKRARVSTVHVLGIEASGRPCTCPSEDGIEGPE